MTSEKCKLSSILGTNFIGANQSTISLDVLCPEENAIVGLYFAASWCTPCHSFTQTLQDFYSKMKDKHRYFEIVLISSDESQAQFDEHLASMPWPALPYSERNLKVRLTRRYRVAGIPALVIINSAGQVVSSHGKDNLLADPDGKNFPWYDRSVDQMLGECEILKHSKESEQKEQVKVEDLTDSVIGLYFSAHWCPPCKAFTPELIDTYNKIRDRGVKFEVIFISSDRSEDSFLHYWNTMPWLSIPFSQADLRSELTSALNVQGIPTLVVLGPGPRRDVWTFEGRAEVNEDPDGELFPWRPRLVEELGEKHASLLQDFPCLIMFVEPDDQEVDFAESVLLKVAQSFLSKREEEYEDEKEVSLDVYWQLPMYCFIGTESEVSESLRVLLGLEEHGTPLTAILELSQQRFALLDQPHRHSGLSAHTVQSFVQLFWENQLNFTHLNR